MEAAELLLPETRPFGAKGPTVADLIACASDCGIIVRLNAGKLFIWGVEVSVEEVDERIAEASRAFVLGLNS